MKFCKWEIYFWLFIALLVFLASCSGSEHNTDAVYFDTKTYIDKEASSILNTHTHYSSFVILNDEKEHTEKIPLDSSALSEMVDLFTKTNINKKIYEGQYHIDTLILEESEIQIIEYLTENKNLEVKWIQKHSNGNLKAKLSKSSFLFSYEKELFYEKNKSFTVKSWQKILGQDTLKVQTEYVFLP